MRLHQILTLAGAAVLLTAALTACAGPLGSSSTESANTAPASTVPPVAPAGATGRISSASTAPGKDKTFAPYDASGRLTARVSGGTLSGSCWTTSIAVPIAGVYRCLSGNEILDPCFAPAVATSPPTVACFADPWTPGTMLRLTRTLPPDAPVLTDGHPWALLLANGAHCVDVTGTVPERHGVALDYRCGQDAVAGLVTSATGGTVTEYGPATGQLQRQGVTSEWRGRSYRVVPGS